MNVVGVEERIQQPRALNFDHTLALLSNLFDLARKDPGNIVLVTTILQLLNEVLINTQHELHRKGQWPEPLCPNCLKTLRVWIEGYTIKWSCSTIGCAWENFDGKNAVIL